MRGRVTGWPGPITSERHVPGHYHRHDELREHVTTGVRMDHVSRRSLRVPAHLDLAAVRIHAAEGHRLSLKLDQLLRDRDISCLHPLVQLLDLVAIIEAEAVVEPAWEEILLLHGIDGDEEAVVVHEKDSIAMIALLVEAEVGLEELDGRCHVDSVDV